MSFNYIILSFEGGGKLFTLIGERWGDGLLPVEEDKRLKVAVMLFGAKNWNKIAQFAPGRTQVQCRER